MGWACASRAVAPIDDGNKKNIFLKLFLFSEEKAITNTKGPSTSVKFTLTKVPKCNFSTANESLTQDCGRSCTTYHFHGQFILFLD